MRIKLHDTRQGYCIQRTANGGIFILWVRMPVLQVWSPRWRCQHHAGICQTCTYLGFSPDLLNSKSRWGPALRASNSPPDAARLRPTELIQAQGEAREHTGGCSARGWAGVGTQYPPAPPFPPTWASVFPEEVNATADFGEVKGPCSPGG